MDRKACPSCGAQIGPDHPQGLCPACLLRQALESDAAGKGAPVSCGNCRSVLADDARFCGYCGSPVPAAKAAEGDPVRSALQAKLQGQYRVVRLLGRGGMGAVYLARDLTLDREVAIKVVKTAAEARELHERFKREARTAARLSHPNIVPLHAFGEIDGMPYFVMGYVRGESLAARLRRDGKLSEEEGRRVFAEIADALDHAHRQGVVHRDIKPDNVLLEDESGRALLTDFGVAKALGQAETLTRAGSVIGTPHYMSPEQAAGRADIDGRSDIYSLGVMAYAMLAGRLPFEGQNPADVLAKHLTQEPPPLRSVAPALSDSTVQATERCLAKDPARRWPDARSLKQALGEVEESPLPDSLHAVQGHGISWLSFAYIWLMPMLAAGRMPLPVKLMNVGVFVFIYLFIVARLRREGFSLRQAQTALWGEPAWWPFWYPRRLRRHGNLWDRLPAAVRRARWLSTALVAYSVVVMTGFAIFIAFVRRFLAGWVQIQLVLFIGMTVGYAAIFALWVFWRARAKRELRRRGLGESDLFRVLIAMPVSRASFWARPHVAAVLLPPAKPAAGRGEETPHDQLQSILRHAQELSGPLRPLGAEAAAAARQLLEAIEHAQQEISELSRNLEPGEQERLADKIAALGSAAGRADEQAPLRQLLEKQLELIRGLEERIEDARANRGRHVEMLKTLALHVASLRARSAETPSEVRSVSERVRALCDEIGRQASALAGIGMPASGVEDMATLDRSRDKPS
jgi:RNA polymerase subunit RPABC4/transcription elongation factor Spt4